MSLSDVIRNIARTVTNKDELKEKAKDLPLMVVQTTLSAAGQALLLVDRMKNSIKGLGGKEEREEEYDSRPSAAEQVAAAPAESSESSEDKPARKEPVIFAPRSGAAESNGVAKAKPDPVIFTPAAKTEPTGKAEPATVTEPADQAKPATVTEPADQAKPATITEPQADAAAVNLTEPLPGWSELTVASLRARMRGKTAEQIGDFLAYERGTTARPEVIKMFENRLAKLQAGE